MELKSFLYEHAFLYNIKREVICILIGERIKIIRNNSGQSQSVFAKHLSVTRNVIAKYENGIVEPPELFIKHMCSEFSVNENWLRTGEGNTYSVVIDKDSFAAKIHKIV